jgi:hypothetical protein
LEVSEKAGGLNGNTRSPRESGIDDDQLVLIYGAEVTGGWQADPATGIIAGFVESKRNRQHG